VRDTNANTDSYSYGYDDTDGDANSYRDYNAKRYTKANSNT